MWQKERRDFAMHYLFGFDNSVYAFLINLVGLCNTHEHQNVRSHMFSLFFVLNEVGFDFFQLITIYSSLDDITQEEIKKIIATSPEPTSILPVSLRSIRVAIPRWTPTKYHTGPIEEVIQEIYSLISNKKKGLYAYNSNLNPKSKRSLNDLYLLLIDDESIRWYDINRRVHIQFENYEVSNNVEDSSV